MNHSSLQGKQVAAFVANDRTGACRERLEFWKNSATMDSTVSRSLKLHGFRFMLLLTFLRNHNLVLLLLLGRFSHVPLCATPETAAHQAPPSQGFSRQEHWSGLPFPSPMHEREKWKWSRSVVSNSSWRHGIFQARAWEWGAIAFSLFCHSIKEKYW